VPGEGPVGKGDPGDHGPVGRQPSMQSSVRQGAERHDGGHTPSIGKRPHGGRQVARKVGEGRIADHHVERPGTLQPVGQLAAVEARTPAAGKQPVQQPRPRGRKLVQGQFRTTGLCHHRHQPRTGGRLQHPVPGPDLSGQHCHGGPLGWGGELVQRHLGFAAAGVGEAQGRDTRQKGRNLGGGIFEPRHLGRQAADLEHGGRLYRLIGVSPAPAALCIRSAEGAGHELGHETAVQGTRACQMDRQTAAGGQDVGGPVGGSGRGEKREAGSQCHGKGSVAGSGGTPPSPPQAPGPALPPPPSSGHARQHRPGRSRSGASQTSGTGPVRRPPPGRSDLPT
jgi:hypothetical protein